MTWIIFIFFTLVLAIESNQIQYKVQKSKSHTQPRPSEILTIFRATSGMSDLKKLNGSTEKVRIQTVDVKKFFLRFQTNVKQLEDVFDRFVFDYVVENLWEYCARVRCLLSEQKHVNSSDVQSVKFEENFDYCIVTYLFNSDKTSDRVDGILNVIYYLETLPYIRFADAYEMKENIDETMNYVIDTIKLYSGDDPGHLEGRKAEEYSTTELIDELRNIRSKISNLSKRFCSIKVPPIMNINIIQTSQSQKYREPNSKFIGSILMNEKISVTYDVFHYGKNKPLFIINDWTVNQIEISTGYQNEYYTELVTTDMSILHTEIKYPQERTPTIIWPIDKSKMTMKTGETLITLSNSLESTFGFDRRSYNNAVQYHCILVDVLMVDATKIGYRILRGIKSIFGEKCMFLSREMHLGIRYTLDIVNLMRSQLLQFRFYYGKMIDLIKKRLNVILHADSEAQYYHAFHKLSLQILDLIDTKTPVDVILKKNCKTLERLLNFIDANKVKGKYFDELKYKRFYFIETTRSMYEIYDYFSSFVNDHSTFSGNGRMSFNLLELPSLLASYLNKPFQIFFDMWFS